MPAADDASQHNDNNANNQNTIANQLAEEELKKLQAELDKFEDSAKKKMFDSLSQELLVEYAVRAYGEETIKTLQGQFKQPLSLRIEIYKLYGLKQV